jgi:hypothetical protein
MWFVPSLTSGSMGQVRPSVGSVPPIKISDSGDGCALRGVGVGSAPARLVVVHTVDVVSTSDLSFPVIVAINVADFVMAMVAAARCGYRAGSRTCASWVLHLEFRSNLEAGRDPNLPVDLDR